MSMDAAIYYYGVGVLFTMPGTAEYNRMHVVPYSSMHAPFSGESPLLLHELRYMDMGVVFMERFDAFPVSLGRRKTTNNKQFIRPWPSVSR